MILRVNCGPKDDIIYINLGNMLVLTLIPNEQSSVSVPSGKTSSQEISCKMLIPGLWILLETRQCLF
jgi:hypothetical protein